MRNIANRTLGEAAHAGGALARGFAALAYPKCLLIMLASAVLSVLLAVGLWYLLHWALFDWQFFNWGWVNWLLRQFGGVALFFALGRRGLVGQYLDRWFDITLPMLRPVLAVSILLNVVFVFNSFPIIWGLTEGGPAGKTDTLVTYLYKVGFKLYDMGTAAAVSVIMFGVLLVFALLHTRLTWRNVLR